jgi:hypothetical protein
MSAPFIAASILKTAAGDLAATGAEGRIHLAANSIVSHRGGCFKDDSAVRSMPKRSRIRFAARLRFTAARFASRLGAKIMSTLLLRIRESESRAAKKEIEDWGAEQDLAARILREHDIEQLSQVQELLEWALSEHEKDKHLLATEYSLLAANLTKDIQKKGETLLRILDDHVEIYARLRSLVQLFADHGQPLKKSQDFEACALDYSRWRETLGQKWPWLNHEQLKKSFASFERGQYRPLKDFFDELQRPANARS